MAQMGYWDGPRPSPWVAGLAEEPWDPPGVPGQPGPPGTPGTSLDPLGPSREGPKGPPCDPKGGLKGRPGPPKGGPGSRQERWRQQEQEERRWWRRTAWPPPTHPLLWVGGGQPSRGPTGPFSVPRGTSRKAACPAGTKWQGHGWREEAWSGSYVCQTGRGHRPRPPTEVVRIGTGQQMPQLGTAAMGRRAPLAPRRAFRPRAGTGGRLGGRREVWLRGMGTPKSPGEEGWGTPTTT